MKTLQSMIRSEMDERGLTYRAVAKRAQEQGHKLSHATVTNYVSGKTRVYTRESLAAIAAGLGLSESKLLDVAGLPMLGEPFELPEEAALLEPHERAAVRSVVDAFIQNRQQQEEVVEDEHDSAPMNQADHESATHHANQYGLAAHPEETIPGDELPEDGP